MSMITCESIIKSYSKNQVLKGVTFTLEPHKIYGLIGRNGAGKTTLLGIVSGQNPATGGYVKYNGNSVFGNQSSLDEICFSREINPTILFGQDTRKVKDILKAARFLFKYWDNDYANVLVKEFELDEKKRINKLSKGMLSAVTIIIALASKAPFTFIDEPVAGLDVFMRDKFYKLLVEEFSSSTRTFVISTHIIDEISGVLEDVIILNDGQIVENENVDSLLSRHRILSGKASEIDSFAKGYKVVHTEELLGNKTICIEIGDIDKFKSDILEYSFDVSKASLQKLFMQLL